MYFAEINIIDESSLRERWDQNVSDSTFFIIFIKRSSLDVGRIFYGRVLPYAHHSFIL